MNALGGITVSLETVKPERAREYLSLNTAGQRRLSPFRVKRYATDMKSGRWGLTHQGIAFNENGDLIDGQHRLAACAESDTAIDFLVFRNVPSSSFTYLDQGRARTSADALRSAGKTSVHQTRGVGGTVLAYQTYPSTVWGGNSTNTQNEVVDFCLEHYDLLLLGASMASSVRQAGVNIYNSSFGAFVVLAIAAGNETEVGDFVESVRTGAMLQVGDPALALRNLESTRRGGSSGWHRQARLAIYIKAFNAFLEGRSVRLLSFRQSELPMPKILAGPSAFNLFTNNKNGSTQ